MLPMGTSEYSTIEIVRLPFTVFNSKVLCNALVAGAGNNFVPNFVINATNFATSFTTRVPVQNLWHPGFTTAY